MFCVTNTRAATKEAAIPRKLVEKSVEQANITPKVRGIKDRYVALAYLIPRKKRYARTVNRGDRPLMVCTSDTGIFDVE